MNDERKTKAELVTELTAWRKRVEELEALATRGRRAEAEQQRHVRTLAGLSEMSKAISAAGDVKELFDSAAVILADNPHVIAGAVYLIDGEPECLRLEKSFGLHPGFYDDNETLALDDADVKSIMWSDTGVFVDGMLGEETWRGLIEEELRTEGHIVAAAMRAESEKVGVFTMILEKADVYTVSFVEMIAAELGCAVRHKRAEEELARYRRHLEEQVERRTEELTAASESLEGEVAERKVTLAELAASEERFRTLAENFRDALVVFDKDEGRIVYVNAAVAEMFGVSLHDVRSMSLKDAFDNFIHEEDKDYLFEANAKAEVARSAGSVEVVDLEYRVRKPDGDVRWVRHRSYPAVTEGVPTSRICVILTDITESKRAEEVLRESAEKYHAIAERAPFGVVIHRDTKILYANDAAREILKFAPGDEVVGLSVFEFIFPEDREALLEAMRERKRGEVPYPYEVKVKCRDGEVKEVEAAGRIFDYGGETAYIVTINDVTERKRAVAALVESEEKYSNLFHGSKDAIFIHDLEGNIVDSNKQASDLYGYSQEEIASLKIADLHPPEALDVSRWAFDTISRDGYVRFEIDFKKMDGSVFPAEVASSMFEVAGKKVVQGIVRDVTERTRAEEAIKESEAQYRTLQANIPAGVFRSSAEPGGCLISANPALAKMFGYDGPEDMYETRVADLYLNPDERKKFIATVSSAEATSDYETQFKRKDGTVFWGSLSARAVKGPDGRFAYFDGIMEDISGRREAEEALAESEEKHRTLVEQATDGVVIVQDGLFKFANPALAELVGYDAPDELIGNEFMPFIAPEFKEMVAEKHRNTMAGVGTPLILEIDILDRDGNKAPVELNTGMIQYEGRPAAIVTVRDLTERKRAEKRITYFSEFARNIIESTQVGIYAVDWKGAVQIWNLGMESQFGVKPDEVVGRNIFEAFPALNEEPLGVAIKKALAGGEPFEKSDLRHKTIKKGERILNTKINPMRDASGGVVGAVVITEDVTERTRAEEKIRYFSEFTENIIGSTQVGIYALDKNGTVQIWNRGMESQFGVASAELVGRNIFVAFPALESEPLGKAITAALERGEAFDESGVKHRTLKKGERILNTKINPLKDSLGGLAGAVVITEDVTEQVDSGEKLRASEERFRTLTANIPVGVFRSSGRPDGYVLSANPALAKMFGCDKPEEMYEMRVADLYVNPDERREFIAAVSSAGALSDYETLFQRKDGTSFWGSLSARAVTGADGKVAYFDGILEDITQRKDAERALAESEEKYRTFVEQATDGVAIAQDGLLKFANRAMAELLGYDDALEIIGKDFDPLIGPGFKEMVAEKHRRTMAGEAVPGIFEIAVLNKAGEEIPVEINAGVVTFEGRPAAMAIVRDIADRKRAEQALAHSVRRNEALLQAIPDMMFVLAKDGTFTDFKADRDEDLVMPRDEIIGKNVRDVGFFDHYVESIFDCMKEALATGEARTLEYELEMPKGLCFYEARVVPVKEDEVLSVVREITDRKIAYDEVKKSLNGTIYAMSKMVETRDPYTSGHQLRVAQLARAIAEEMSLSNNQVEGIFLAAVVHDVGKISIPEGILSKPGPLSELELNIIKNHPQVGFDILKKVEFAKPITKFVLQHHERLDGSGYPLGLKDRDIAVEARILSVADVVEAMSSHRPFRPALGQEKALDEISSFRGVLYDADVVDVCLRLFKKEDFRFN
jgi:PAS domain S-box-containing protein/putative nucleotidyltransferase with HDIG domain